MDHLLKPFTYIFYSFFSRLIQWIDWHWQIRTAWCPDSHLSVSWFMIVRCVFIVHYLPCVNSWKCRKPTLRWSLGSLRRWIMKSFLEPLMICLLWLLCANLLYLYFHPLLAFTAVSLLSCLLAAPLFGRMFVQSAGRRLLQAALLWTHWLCVCC